MRILVSRDLALSLVAGRAAATDYDRIERQLTREPAYQAKKPSYALLVFGPEARLKVWVVLDGETLYVDRYGDGEKKGAR